MNTFIGILLIVFLVANIGKQLLVNLDSTHDDKFERYERHITELQSRINELEERL